jgi:molybdate transport system ATP-binding protein
VTDGGAERLEARLKGRLGAFELDAELDVPAQGVTALVGPSGCGKTSVLRCLAGFCRLPGRVTFRGEAWQDGRTFAPPHRRPVGYVFQEASLFPHLTVRGNLTFALKRAARAGASPAHGFDELVALLAVEPLLDRATQKLSGGERQRVAIARALAAQPRLLLMDEPVSSLDPDAKADVLGRLEPAMAVLRIPMVYVSHDPMEVTRLADRVLTMAGGRIAQAPPGQAADVAETAVDAMAPEEVRRLAIAALKAGLQPN